eukprot:5465654-Alexandrium_andersonii.AAC.1
MQGCMTWSRCRLKRMASAAQDLSTSKQALLEDSHGPGGTRHVFLQAVTVDLRWKGQLHTQAKDSRDPAPPIRFKENVNGPQAKFRAD